MNRFVLTLNNTVVNSLLNRLVELGPIEYQYRGPIMYIETKASLDMMRALVDRTEDVMQILTEKMIKES